MAVSPVNAFTPSNEIRDIDRLAGREDVLRSLARSLESDGSQIVLYGNRGVGKSSIARVLEQMARNDEKVLQRIEYKPTNEFDFLTVYFSCDDSVKDIPQLLLRLLSDSDALADWLPFKVVKRDAGLEQGAKLDVKIFSLSGTNKNSATEEAAELDSDVVSVFVNALRKIRKSGLASSGILLVIDEFDRIRDRSGLASLIKALSPENVKFALVGVASNVGELIAEHQSVARQLTDGTLEVPPMSEAEMNEIFDSAEDLLDKKYSFSKEARNWIIEIARGHPFYVHLLGKHALLRAIDSNVVNVLKEHAESAMNEIALKGSAPVQEGTYKKSIGHSYSREYVLKAFAGRKEEEVHTTELYAKVASELGIDPNAISVYVGQLGTDKYGSVLEKIRDRYYRFSDSLFKAYAAARPFQLKKGEGEQ